MSRVLFLNPASDHLVNFTGRFVDPFASHPPLHLAYLAAKLIEAGHEAFIEDFGLTLPPKHEVVNILQRHQPDIVGLTCYTITYNNAIKLSKLVRQVLPDALIIMGGQHVSFIVPETLTQEPTIDAIVRLEGEETIIDLVECHEGGSDLGEVAGIGYRRDGEVVLTEKRPLPRDLDRIVPMPAWELLHITEYQDPGTLITSRGCTGACIFCVANAIYHTSTRHHSAKRIIAEIEKLTGMCGPLTMLHFVDDDFLHDRQKVVEVCDYLIKHQPQAQWACSARVDAIDAELMTIVSKAGCRRVEIGVETGSATILARLGKKIDLDQVETATKAAIDNGINVAASFIIGHPQDTLKTVSESIVFARHLRQLRRPPAQVFTPFNILTPYPGTPIERHADRLGLTIHTHEYNRYTAQQAVMSNQYLSVGQLNAIYEFAMREFNKNMPGKFVPKSHMTGSNPKQENRRKREVIPLKGVVGKAEEAAIRQQQKKGAEAINVFL